MFLRIISGVIGFPIFTIFIILGGFYLKVLIFTMSLIAMRELFKINFNKKLSIRYFSYIFLIIYYFFIINNIVFENFIALIYIYILCNLIYLVVYYEKITIYDIGLNIFNLFYGGIIMSSIYLVREIKYGEYFVWFIFISAWGCDTFAYFIGKFLGKNKLIPRLSPNKTIEGSIGGILGAGILGFIYCLTISKFFINIPKKYLLYGLIISILGAVLAQFGDLSASSVKRYAKVKDYGKIIPGHGGIMDRFDSIIFTAPLIYIIMLFFIK